jgi:hypothetical protein
LEAATRPLIGMADAELETKVVPARAAATRAILKARIGKLLISSLISAG